MNLQADGVPLLRLLLLAIGGAGCGPLLPDERVLGDEVPAFVLDGVDGSGFGSALAMGRLGEEMALAVWAPGLGEVHLFGLDGEALRVIAVGGATEVALGFGGGRLSVLVPGQGLFEHDDEGQISALADAASTAMAICPEGERRLLAEPGAAIACGPEGEDLRAMGCDASSCDVYLDGAWVGTGSPGSALGFDGSVACWGTASLEVGEAGGRVDCQDGRSLEGVREEHLGLAFAQGRTAGRVTKGLRPIRARVLHLGEEEGWTVDVAVEATPLVLAEHEGWFAVGAPGFPGRSSDAGRVYLVDPAWGPPGAAR